MKKVNVELNNQKKALVLKLLNGKVKKWPLEFKAVNILLQKNPDITFWFWFAAHHKEYCSILQILSDFNTTDIIQEDYKEFQIQTKLLIPEIQKNKLEDNIVGDNIKTEFAIKKLSDFIK